MTDTILNVAVIGASGYTGADAVRLLARHPQARIAALVAERRAGEAMDAVFPHFPAGPADRLVKADDVDWSAVDVAVCGLPHGTAQEVIAGLPSSVKVVDMSADFRLRDAGVYAQWYGRSHDHPALLAEAVYGLTEHYRDPLRAARLAACPGCFPTAALLMLIPLAAAGLIDVGDVVIDAKTGVSGAGRGLKEGNLFCEVAEALRPYGVASHRHAPEIEQEIGRAAGAPPRPVSFTPHLVPMNRGELLTCHLRLADGAKAADLRAALHARYADEAFVHLLPEGRIPTTAMVRGSNHAVLQAVDDRIPGRAIAISALDNLVKGSAGQAVQNINVMTGLPETLGLEQLGLFP